MNQDQSQGNTQDQKMEAAKLGFPTEIPKNQLNQGFSDFSNMTPEDAKAALGHSSAVMEQIMAQQAIMEGRHASQNQPQTPQEPQGDTEMKDNGEDEKKEMEDLKTEILGSLKEEIKSAVKEEMSGLRKEIQDAIKD